MKKQLVEYIKTVKALFLKKVPPEDRARNQACCNGKFITLKERLILAIECDAWNIQSTPFFVVDDQKAKFLGRNLISIIGIKLIQEKPEHKQVLTTTEVDTSHPDTIQKVK